MADDLIALVQAMDRCWIERRFDDLAAYLADDIVMVAPGGKHRREGLNGAVESYRGFMSSCEVRRFETSDYVVTRRGSAVVVEYDWDMAWSDQGAEEEAKGREVLMLAQRDEGWRIVWRMQLSA